MRLLRNINCISRQPIFLRILLSDAPIYIYTVKIFDYSLFAAICFSLLDNQVSIGRQEDKLTN